jgi:hypothetical protein
MADTSLDAIVRFPTKSVTTKDVFHISQIEYSLRPHSTPSITDLIEVWAYNNKMIRDGDNPYPWRIMPSIYANFLLRILFRLESLKHAAINGRGSAEHLRFLKQYLLHVDRVLDEIWDESRDAVAKKMMNANWRSPSLDVWLAVEYRIQRHTEWDIDALKEEGESDLMEDSVKVFDLGERILQCSVILTFFLHTVFSFRLGRIRCTRIFMVGWQSLPVAVWRGCKNL